MCDNPVCWEFRSPQGGVIRIGWGRGRKRPCDITVEGGLPDGSSQKRVALLANTNNLPRDAVFDDGTAKRSGPTIDSSGPRLVPASRTVVLCLIKPPCPPRICRSLICPRLIICGAKDRLGTSPLWDE